MLHTSIHVLQRFCNLQYVNFSLLMPIIVRCTKLIVRTKSYILFFFFLGGGGVKALHLGAKKKLHCTKEGSSLVIVIM